MLTCAWWMVCYRALVGPLNNGGFYCWVLGVDHLRGAAEDTGRGYWGDVKHKLVKELPTTTQVRDKSTAMSHGVV